MAPRFQLLPLSTPTAPALPTPLGLPTLASNDTNRPAAAVRRIRDRFAVIFNLSKISNQTLFQVAGDSDSSKFLWLNESKLVWGRGCWTVKKSHHPVDAISEIKLGAYLDRGDGICDT